MKDLFELNKTIRFDYTGQPEPLVLDLGVYDFECHGAQGCGPYGGYGGVMAGRYTAISPITLWMYIGNTLTSNVGGWNGGGTGAMPYGGGGATDIALLYGEWDSVEHLYSRILVAGGGGGCTTQIYGSSGEYIPIWHGGQGGGEYGNNGSGPSYGYGAGPDYAGYSSWNYCSRAGGFGYGGGAGNWYSEHIGCGGGGWYGGSSASGANLNGSGGGGSGYCYCERTKMYYPSGCLLDDSHLLLEIPTIEPNNTGNGYILVKKVHNIDRKNTNLFKDARPQDDFDINSLFG